MRTEYDFNTARPNPYAKLLKQPVTIRLDAPTIAYFKALADELDLPYQTLINLYLRDCAAQARKPDLSWRTATAAPAKTRAVPKTRKPAAKRASRATSAA